MHNYSKNISEHRMVISKIYTLKEKGKYNNFNTCSKGKKTIWQLKF